MPVPAPVPPAVSQAGGYALVLNASYEPLCVVPQRRALLLVLAQKAMAIEDAQRRTILPLGRRTSGRGALDGGLTTQVDHVEHEAGIREQL